MDFGQTQNIYMDTIREGLRAGNIIDAANAANKAMIDPFQAGINSLISGTNETKAEKIITERTTKLVAREKTAKAWTRKLAREDKKAEIKEEAENYIKEVEDIEVDLSKYDLIDTDVADQFKDLRTLGKTDSKGVMVTKLASKNFFLTYSNCDEKKSEVEANVKVLLRNGAKGTTYYMNLFVIAQELHKSGVPHFHIICCYDKARQITNYRVFDIVINGKTYHPNIQSMSTNNDVLRVKGYVCKFDKAHAREHIRCDMIQTIFRCETLAEALITIGSRMAPRDVEVYWNSKAKVEIEQEPIVLPEFGWYKRLDKIIKYDTSVPDYRKIYWFRDTVGNTGKSVYAIKKLIEGEAHYISSVGKEGDFNHNIRLAVEGGWDQKILFVDMPRTVEQITSLYACLESLKNGVVTCTKYDSQTKVVRRGMVLIVLANWWPKINKMSQDRWRLYNIPSTEEAVRTHIDAVRIERKEEERATLEKKIRKKVKTRINEETLYNKIKAEMLMTPVMPVAPTWLNNTYEGNLNQFGFVSGFSDINGNII